MRLTIRATPKAARDEIAGLRNGAVIVKVTAAPDKGKANQSVIALLAKSIGIPKSALEIVGGETSRNKVVEVSAQEEHVKLWLQGLEEV